MKITMVNMVHDNMMIQIAMVKMNRHGYFGFVYRFKNCFSTSWPSIEFSSYLAVSKQTIILVINQLKLPALCALAIHLVKISIIAGSNTKNDPSFELS